MSNKVYLIDGSGYIFRAFFAIQYLTTRSGFPTNALYGFTKMLLKLLEAADSDHVLMIFDSGRETFRTEMYPLYKANREECPEDLKKQMPFFRDISKALGLKILELPGYEADDIIATLANKLEKEKIETVIVSADKDLMQLVGDHTHVWDTMRDKRYRAPEVKEKFGVLPDKVVEVLGLMGDTSDNIPGVKGVGPKTAAQLIEKYGTVADVLKSLEKIKIDKEIRGREKIVETIELNPEILRLSRQLVEVKKDCPLDMEVGSEKKDVSLLSSQELLDWSCRQDPDQEVLQKLIEKFEFTSLFRGLSLRAVNQAEPAKDFVGKLVLSPDFPRFCEKLKQQSAFAFDTETDSLNPLEAKIIGMSFCWGADDIYYLPLRHNSPGQVFPEMALSLLKPIFENPKIKKFGQNCKYDIAVMKTAGIAVRGVEFDTLIAAYLISPDKGSYNLTVLARDYLSRGTIEFDEVLGERATFAEVPLEAAVKYASQDAFYVWELKAILEQKLTELGLNKVFSQIEMPLVSVLAEVERNGLKLDTEFLRTMSSELAIILATQEQEIEALAGEKFNQNSPKQLSAILFEKLKLPTDGLKKTKTGVSTDSATLEKLADLHPLPAKILEYREIFKLKSTYLDALPEYVSAVSGRLHTSLNQTIAATGRLSSSNPNMQNIPIQSELGRKVRKAFIAEQGKVLISADYSQIELRVLAHLSNDKNLIAAFAEDRDVHAQTAREILGIPESMSVSTEDRRLGKTINFGIVYGMGPFRLSRDLKIPMKVANNYIENYFKLYAGVKQYFDGVEKQLSERGFVETLFGRKRFLDQIDSAGRDKGFRVRAALNAPIQGTAADIIKLAMIKVQQELQASDLDCQLILQVHDELLFETAEKDLVAATKIIKQVMEHVVTFNVPLQVGIGSGTNWQEAH